MLADLWFVLRVLARNRTFTLVTSLTLALGIGSAASIFSVADYILFRSNSYPKSICLVGGQSEDGTTSPIRYEFMARAYAEQTDAMSEYCKATFKSGNIVVNGQPVGTGWLAVSPNFFAFLGIHPGQGRGFLPQEATIGADNAIVISESFWQQQLQGKPNVVGTQVIVGDAVCTVVGVLESGQVLPSFFMQDVFRPLVAKEDPAQPWASYVYLMGKLKVGMNREQATQALNSTRPDIPTMMRKWLTNDRVVLSTLGEMNKYMRPEIYWVLLAAVGFLYAIACLNASNLMLVRMLGQRRQHSVRLALGCGRWRLIRLLALESVTLAILASLVGMLIANWLFPLLLQVAGSKGFVPDWIKWSLGWRVMAVFGLLTVMTSALIVAIPAFRILRTDINSGLKDGGAALGESPALARLRGLFVVLQAAFALILLAAAGLMIRTFHQLEQVDLGFDATDRAKMTIGFPANYPGAPDVRLIRMREIQEHMRHIPGVRDVGFSTEFLLSGFYFANSSMKGADGRPLKAAWIMFNIGFPELTGLKLKAGRWLNQTNGNEVMVSESFAKARWPGQSAVGQFVELTSPNKFADKDWKGWLVVGVMGDVRSTIRGSPGLAIICPEGWGGTNMNSMVIRLSRPYNEALSGLIRRDLYAYDPSLVVHQIVPLSGLRDQQLWIEHLADSVLKVLATIALLLTIVGIFSVLAYTVDRRMPEFGVRMALGATRQDLLRMILRRGVLLTLLGVLVGVAGSVALTKYLQSLLFETSAQDPWVLGIVGVILLLTSVLACLIPARRATKVDITKLLRSE